MSITARVAGTAIGLVVVFALLGLAFDWFGAGVDIVSPENVKQQYRQAYDRYESLKTTAGNVCTARRDEKAEISPEVKPQLASQRRAYEQNYGVIASQYNAAFDDVFRAKHVGPEDLPADAPDLEAMLAKVGCKS